MKKKVKTAKKTAKKTVTKKTPRKKAFPKFEMFKKILFNNPGITPTQAVIDAGYRCRHKHSASAIASENLTKLGITMPEILDKAGLNDGYCAIKLKQLSNAKTTKFFQYEGKITDEAEVDDNTTQLKSIELAQKIKGNLKENIDVTGGLTHELFIGNAIKRHQELKQEEK